MKSRYKFFHKSHKCQVTPVTHDIALNMQSHTASKQDPRAQPIVYADPASSSLDTRALSFAPSSVLEKVEIGWDMGSTNHLPSPLTPGGGPQTSASEKVSSSDDPEAELAASLLAQPLLLLAVLLAELFALLHGRRRILVAFLLLDPALVVVDEAVAIVLGRRRGRRRRRIAQVAGLLALCQLHRVIVLALLGDALLVGVLARRYITPC